MNIIIIMEHVNDILNRNELSHPSFLKVCIDHQTSFADENEHISIV